MKWLKILYVIFFALFILEKPAQSQVNENEYYGDYDVLFYKLDLNVGDTSIFIEGSATINVRLFSKKERIKFNLASGYDIDSILVNNKTAQFSHDSDTIAVTLPLLDDSVISTQVFYKGYAYTDSDEKGIFNRYSNISNSNYTYTLSEPFEALYFFPCKQDLKDKADSVYVFISTDKNLKAGANGILENVVDLPGNRVRYEWKSRYKIDYYLISFAVSNYLEYNFYTRLNEDDSIFVQNYIYNDSTFFETNKEEIEKTGDYLILFSELFGPYPFIKEKYGHSNIPAGGGMEHQTMTSLSSFYPDLVSHELAHQWFGDNVTCATWQDIWINEGFASYGEYLAKEFLNSKDEAIKWMIDAHEIIKSDPGGSVFVPAELSNNKRRIFNGSLSYKKGAAIIHMIRQEVNNDDLFFDILKTFQEVYTDSVATAEDFKNIAEIKTGKNFDLFFQQWYYGEGYPKFRFSWIKNNDTLKIRSVQESSVSDPAFFNVLVEFRIKYYNKKDTIVTFRQTTNYEEFEFISDGLIQSVAFDPFRWIIAEELSFTNIEDSVYPDNIFTIAPNPVKDKLSIIFKHFSGEYKIYLNDLNGKLIKIIEAKSKYVEMDVSNQQPGIYVLIIEADKRLYPVTIILSN